MQQVDVTIIGCGPAGMTAALYLTRGGYSVAIFDGEGIGGQMSKAPLIENYPGFVGSGADLAEAMWNQLGDKAELYLETVEDIMSFEPDVFTTFGEFGTEITSRAVIIATGGKPKTLYVPGVDKPHVHYCATCDGPLYKNKTVALIGDANSALQYALELANMAKEVHVLALFDRLFGEEIWRQRVLEKDNIHVHYKFATKEITDHTVVAHSGEKVEADGVFIAIGYEPNVPHTTLFCPRTDAGYICTSDDCSIDDDFFAIGDVRAKRYRQVASAVNDGMTAALKLMKNLQL